MNNDNKLTPKYRFPAFKNDGNWALSTINSVAEIKGRIGYRGYTTSDIVEKGQGAITLSPSNIIDGKLNFDKATYISWEKYDESPEIMLEEGHTVLVKTASVGKTAYVSNLPEKTTLNPQIIVLKPYDKINKKLLSYCIAHDFTQRMILNKVGAGAIPNLSQESIGNIEITFPNNPTEQQKIAACLSSLDDVIVGHEEKLTALEEHKKGLMQNLFPQEGETQPKYRFPEFEHDGDWVEDCIGNYMDLFSGIAIKSEDITDDENGTPILRGINITEGFIRHSNDIDKYYPGPIEPIKKYLTKVNDIVIGMDGSKVGKNVAQIKKRDENSILIQRVACIRNKNNSDGNYLYQQFISNRFIKYVDNVNTSSGIPHISAQQIKDFNIMIPPIIAEQQKIASVLSSVDELIVVQREKIAALTEHKKGLMQGLFPKIES